MKEAIERGQLDLGPSSHFARQPKRRKISSQMDNANGQGSRRHVNRGKTKPGSDSNGLRKRWGHRKGQEPISDANAALSAPRFPEHDEKESDDDDAEPEEVSSKMPDSVEIIHPDETVSTTPSTLPQPQERRLKGPQPRGPLRNPFASRPALLRNVQSFLFWMSFRSTYKFQ